MTIPMTEIEKEFYILEDSGRLSKTSGYADSNQKAQKKVSEDGSATIVIRLQRKNK